MNMNLPNKEWTLPQLAEFCVLTLRRRAEDAHHVGTALTIARGRHKADREWLVWLETNVEISRATAYRYMEIATRLTVEDCTGLPLKDVYSLVERQKHGDGVEPPEPESFDGASQERESEKQPDQDEADADAGDSSHPEKDETEPTDPSQPQGHTPEMTWVVNDDDQDYMGTAADAFAAVLTGFLDGNDAAFMQPADKRALAAKFLAVEKLLRRAKAGLVPNGRRAA